MDDSSYTISNIITKTEGPREHANGNLINEFSPLVCTCLALAQEVRPGELGNH